uniref:Helicase C-terminal domain-containing protein n=1 Tax=Timspurckia oligopyrenoides TaxID=708627 RepID=A0A7S0ZIR7_9RHOD
MVLGDEYETHKHSASVIEDSDVNRSAKLRILETLLSNWKKAGHKVLIFSQYTTVLDVIGNLAIRHGYLYERLDGSIATSKRQTIVDRFNRSNITFLFLASTKAAGLGLNITSADRVVIFDPTWNPTYDLQAQDRSYRLGQTRHVKVFRLVTAHTLEEPVYSRQVFKHQLSLSTIEDYDEKRYFQSHDLKGFESLFKHQATRSKEHKDPRTKQILDLVQVDQRDQHSEMRDGGDRVGVDTSTVNELRARDGFGKKDMDRESLEDDLFKGQATRICNTTTDPEKRGVVRSRRMNEIGAIEQQTHENKENERA